ncbi:glucokinase [Thiohalorhabdus methylotrophus]|uniref:Glucokinase n=1 Tax=Thiohalorhabdus methylotrophus TaxID=3242694 RepID=A0ABV4TXV4_9GAMM
MKVLVGDVGGTKTRLALVKATGGRLEVTVDARFPSPEFSGLEEVVRAFLAEHPESGVQAAAFGLPGPVLGGHVRTTNLPWKVRVEDLAEVLAVNRVHLLNDLEAAAYGIGELAAEDLAVIAEGSAERGGNRALIAAGTGLGEAALFWDGIRYHPFATEGGHADFAAADTVDYALHRYLADRHDHVSWEKVVSGPGLVNIHAFLCSYRDLSPPEWLAEEMRAGDPASAVAAAAEQRRCPVCVEAVDRFLRYYGMEAGNLALKVMATGGVYLGGGIAPRMVGRLREGALLEGFLAKGRMRPLMERIPVTVIRDDRIALLGAARYALSA